MANQTALTGVVETFDALHDLAVKAREESVPYDNIARYATDNGWRWHLLQTEAIAGPTGSTLVTFEIVIGRKHGELGETPDRTEIPMRSVDKVSVAVDSREVHITGVALARVGTSLLYRLLGYTPPAPPPAEPQAAYTGPAPDGMNGGAAVVQMQDRDTRLEDTSQFKITKGWTPDGLPLLTDLYEIDASITEDAIISAVMELVRSTIGGIGDVHQLTAFYQLNEDALSFVKEFDGERAVEIAQMFSNRNNELSAPPDVNAASTRQPRRRSRAVPVN